MHLAGEVTVKADADSLFVPGLVDPACSPCSPQDRCPSR
jgi:hypothetical protein